MILEKGSLGNITKSASFSDFSPYLDRFRLQSVSRVLIPNERVSFCLRHRAYGCTHVELLYSMARQRASYSGLMTCGSVWVCPVCSSKISVRRAEELREALEGKDHNLLFVTFTLKHNKFDSLEALLEALNAGCRRLKSGRFWQNTKADYGIYGSITGLEVLYGANGWHPHKHALFFVDKRLSKESLHLLNNVLNFRFIKCLQKYGFDGVPGISVKTDYAEAGIEWYLSKWGISKEMAGISKKGKSGSNTPFELLRLYAEGEKQAGNKYKEFAKTIKGKRQLVYTKGLKKLLNISDKSDEDLARDIDINTYVLVLITPEQWNLILRNNARVELLKIASTGNPIDVTNFLESIGIQIFEDL